MAAGRIPPTFPHPLSRDPAPSAVPGMTLRDFFAGHAIQCGVLVIDDAVTPEALAARAYAIADAMLAERERGHDAR